METTTSKPASLSTTDHAAAIRAQYKAKGWNARKISVRASYYSMGSSIYVTIKDASIPMAEAEAIAKGAERIDRCEFSGEILCGGNRFVDVKYDSAVLEAMGAQYLDAVKAAAANLKAEGENDNHLYPIGDTGLMVGRGSNGYGFSLWSEQGHLSQHGNYLDSIARAVAIKMVGR